MRVVIIALYASTEALIYNYILIYKIKLSKLPTPGSALLSEDCAVEMVGSFDTHAAARGQFAEGCSTLSIISAPNDAFVASRRKPSCS